MRRWVTLCILMAGACADRAPSPSQTERGRSYHQPFTADAAMIIVEDAAGQSVMSGSGFVISPEKGIFMTAEHVTNEFGKMGGFACKIFFNGAVYDALPLSVPPIRDAGLLIVVSPFSSDAFRSAPAVVLQELVKGSRVTLKGIHPHPVELTALRASQGKVDLLIPIYSGYYRDPRTVHQRPLTREAVYDQLPGVVEAVDERIRLSGENQMQEDLQYQLNTYVKIHTDENHVISFGGLSGGPVLNESGQVIGVISAEAGTRWEFDKNAPDGAPWLLNLKMVTDTVFITPLTTVKDLLDRAAAYQP